MHPLNIPALNNFRQYSNNILVKFKSSDWDHKSLFSVLYLENISKLDYPYSDNMLKFYSSQPITLVVKSSSFC